MKIPEEAKPFLGFELSVVCSNIDAGIARGFDFELMQNAMLQGFSPDFVSA